MGKQIYGHLGFSFAFPCTRLAALSLGGECQAVPRTRRSHRTLPTVVAIWVQRLLAIIRDSAWRRFHRRGASFSTRWTLEDLSWDSLFQRVWAHFCLFFVCPANTLWHGTITSERLFWNNHACQNYEFHVLILCKAPKYCSEILTVQNPFKVKKNNSQEIISSIIQRV